MACLRRPRGMTLALLWLLGGIALTGVWPRAVYGHAHHGGSSTDDHSTHSAPGASSLSPAADVLHLAGDGGAGRAVLNGDAVTVAWAVHSANDTVTLAASTAKPCYALGVALGSSMVNSTAYVAWINHDDGAGYVVSYYMNAKRGDHVLPTGEALSNTAVYRLPAGGLSFRLSRGREGSGGGAHPHSDTLVLDRQPLVWGCFPSWSVTGLFDHPLHDDMHTSWSKGPTVVDLVTGTVLSGGGHASMWGDTSASGPGRAIVAHAVLMALAWGLLFPAAALVARHGRDPPGAWAASLFPVGGSAWFKAHLVLVTSALVAVCVAFGVIYSHVGGSGAPHFEGTHQQLGLLTFILLLFQPLNGLLRPPKAKHGEGNTGARKAWEFGHKWLGRLLVGLACGLVVTTGLSEMGRDGASHGAVSGGQAAWVLWCVAGLGGVTGTLEVARKQKRAEARVSAAAAAAGAGGAGNAL